MRSHTKIKKGDGYTAAVRRKLVNVAVNFDK